MRAIYKICSVEEWAQAVRQGRLDGSDVDRRDGFIHFSTREQVAETAAKHFANQQGLVLVKVDADRLGAALKWESSRGGALFPHLYGPLHTSAVLTVYKLSEDKDACAAFVAGLS